MEYKFTGNRGVRVYFESRDSLAAKSAIPCLYVGRDRDGNEYAHLDMVEMATRNMLDSNVTMFGGGNVGESGEFTFAASKFKDGSCLYAVIHEPLSFLVGSSLATVGVYAYDSKRDNLEGAEIMEEYFAEPTASQRDVKGDDPDGTLAAKAKAEYQRTLGNKYDTVIPLADHMATEGGIAAMADISPESLAKLLKLLN